VNDGPKSLKHFMIIDRVQLAGKDCPPEGVLYATDRALDLLGIVDVRRSGSRSGSRSRRVEHFVQVRLLPCRRSICQRQGQQLADRVVGHRNCLVVPDHRIGTARAEDSNQLRQSAEQTVDRPGSHSRLSRKSADRQRADSSSSDDPTRNAEQMLTGFVIVLPWSPHARHNNATMLRYIDTKGWLRAPESRTLNRDAGTVPETECWSKIMTFDVIVVGARVAGAATGMLLARAGLRVLVVDQAHFPSDTLSTHQIQLPGVARLARFGLLQPLLDAGTPPTPHVRFQAGGAVIEAGFPVFGGVDMMISPRRTILDALLIDAARSAGVEVREGCSLVKLTSEHDRVNGVRLQHRRGGGSMIESAALVVGADGKHSTVARLVGATERRAVATATFAFYTYWDGLPVKGGEIYSGTGFAASAWPTNDGLTMTYVAGRISDFDAVRRDPTTHLITILDKVGSLGERARGAVQVGPTRGTSDLPNVVRAAHGLGWALAGDAGLVMDPITGLGIGHALRDAELLSTAIVNGLDGSSDLNGALNRYEKQRNRETTPAFNWTMNLARLRGVNDIEERLFTAIGGDEADASRFFGVLTGVVPMRSFFSPAHLIRLIGAKDFLRLARARSR